MRLVDDQVSKQASQSQGQEEANKVFCACAWLYVFMCTRAIWYMRGIQKHFQIDFPFEIEQAVVRCVLSCMLYQVCNVLRVFLVKWHSASAVAVVVAPNKVENVSPMICSFLCSFWVYHYWTCISCFQHHPSNHILEIQYCYIRYLHTCSDSYKEKQLTQRKIGNVFCHVVCKYILKTKTKKHVWICLLVCIIDAYMYCIRIMYIMLLPCTKNLHYLLQCSNVILYVNINKVDATCCSMWLWNSVTLLHITRCF